MSKNIHESIPWKFHPHFYLHTKHTLIKKLMMWITIVPQATSSVTTIENKLHSAGREILKANLEYAIVPSYLKPNANQCFYYSDCVCNWKKYNWRNVKVIASIRITRQLLSSNNSSPIPWVINVPSMGQHQGLITNILPYI